MNLLRIIISNNFTHSNIIKSFNNDLNELKFSDNLEYIKHLIFPFFEYNN